MLNKNYDVFQLGNVVGKIKTRINCFSDEVLLLRDGSINIYDMVSLYDIEEEAQDRLDLAEAILYNFDRQPFLDMRYLVTNCSIANNINFYLPFFNQMHSQERTVSKNAFLLFFREVAHQQFKKENERLKKEEISEEERTDIEDKLCYWDTQKTENEANLSDLQISLFDNLLAYLMNCQDRMIEDEVRFGKERFSSSAGKMFMSHLH